MQGDDSMQQHAREGQGPGERERSYHPFASSDPANNFNGWMLLQILPTDLMHSFFFSDDIDR
jgi:hypothetical protein